MRKLALNVWIPSFSISYTYKHTFFKTKTGDMKITIFHLVDLPYLSMCISFRSMTSKAVFHRTCPWHCLCFPPWAGRQSPPYLAIWAVSYQPKHLQKPLLCRNACHQSLMWSSACFAGIGWSPWLKERAFVYRYKGSYIRAFPLPNYMPRKPGRSNPSLSLHWVI